MFYTTVLLAAAISGGAMAPSDTLLGATVSAEKIRIASSRDTISFQNTADISQALMAIPGLQISDNGGLSGLKTVSFRGLGSAHTTINIDGMKVVNVQSGQNDLGMLSQEDYSSAVIDYATNSISFISARPLSRGAKVSAKAGSFGTWQGRGEYSHIFKNELALKASVNGMGSKGNFPYGDGLRREGNELKKIQAGVDLFSKIGMTKLYVNASDRNIPGATSYPSPGRQKDINAYLQDNSTIIQPSPSRIYSLAFNKKFSYDDMQYITQYANSRYRQSSFTMDVVNNFRIKEWLSAQATLNFEEDLLKGDYEARRSALRPSLSVFADRSRLKASAVIDWQIVRDRGNKSISALSPSLQVRYTPVRHLELSAFTRRAYRMPNFNDLYYPYSGNPELKSEDAWLSDASIALNLPMGNVSICTKADIFFNSLKDKISWAPTLDDPNIWLPSNIGRVSNLGTDLSARIAYSKGKVRAGLTAKYTYMNAVDKTPDSASYGEQIAYVPKHGANIIVDVAYNGTSACLTWNMRAGIRDAYVDMPSWNTLDMMLKQKIGKNISLELSGRNLTNHEYELSSGYPMPGISVLGGIEICF